MACGEVAFSFSISVPAVIIANLFLFALEGVSSESTTNVEGFIAMCFLSDGSHGRFWSFCYAITSCSDLNSWYNHLTCGDCSYNARACSSLTFCSTWRREKSTTTAEVDIMVSCWMINWIKGSFITINYISNYINIVVSSQSTIYDNLTWRNWDQADLGADVYYKWRAK